jgi:thermitase
MTRPSRRARIAPAPACESLEVRALLATSLVGQPTPIDPDPASTLLVGFVNGTPPATIRAALAPLNAKVTESFPNGPSIVALGSGITSQTAIARLSGRSFVRYAEPDSTIHVESTGPNDQLFPLQWGLSNSNGIDVDATNAWNVTHGSPGIVVAVVDSGLFAGDPDLAGQLWTDPKTGIHGWNFINNNPDVSDFDGHGTHVAGIIAAAGNNGYGGLGLAWGVKLMPLKFIKSNGNGVTAQAVQAIYFAVQHGARVINASWGGPLFDRGLHDAIAYAAANNVVFVTAAGNESANNDFKPSYPALDRFPNTLSVAAIDQAGNLASFSNYGSRTVDLAAPGVNIESTIPTGFAAYSGTSMSAPFVSATAALVLSVHPNWSAAQVVRQIVATVRPLPSLAGRTISGGMVDAAAAVGAVPVPSQALGAPTAAISSDAAHGQILSSDAYYAIHGGTDSSYLNSLYRTILGRDIDAGGLAFWMGSLQSGASRTGVVAGIMSSAEAVVTKVASWLIQDVGLPASSLAALTQSPIVGDWALQLISGAATETQIRVQILGSDQYFAFQQSNPLVFVNALYQDILGRPVDKGGAFTWVGQLLAGRPRADVVLSILSSPEAKLSQAARWFAADYAITTPLGSIKSTPAVIAWSQQLVG